MFYYHYASPLGTAELRSDGEVLTGLDFTKTHKSDGMKNCPPVIARTVEWLDIYFSGREPGFTPELGLSGTPFSVTVWRILQRIPYGRVTTYKAVAGEAAAILGVPRMSPQAAGGAVGRNPVALIIPCHRVIGSDGSLTGYASGVWRKAYLLGLERADPYRPFTL